MSNNLKNILYENFKIEEKIIDYVNEIERDIEYKFKDIDKIKEYNQFKVISAMQKAKLSATDFGGASGYGYGDVGRDKTEEIYSYVFKAEDALVRPTIVSGTHAITLSISGIVRPGEELLSITGAPYDTLLKVLGVDGNEPGTLMEYGLKYKQVDLNKGKIDIDKALETITDKTRMVLIQRSTGYSDRKAITIDEMSVAIMKIKEKFPNIIIFIDNCYGEFTEEREPIEVGADIIAGSLIKNPGGGLALAGGYIAGREDLVYRIANRSTAPGLGKDCGLTFGTTRSTLQGLFLAPTITSEALKGALLNAGVYKKLGYEVVPNLDDKRSDIIQGIKFNNREAVIKYCQGIQAASVVDSYVTPIPWEMPGYDDEVIMASGSFIDGSSIELSADGPMREPYFAYYQGGLTYSHCRLGVMISLMNLYKNEIIKKEQFNI